MSAAAVLPVTRFPRRLRVPDGTRGRRIALAGCALLLLLGAVRLRDGEARIRLELDAARQEGRRLSLRREVLRDRMFAFARRLEALESGRSAIAAGTTPHPSPPGAGR